MQLPKVNNTNFEIKYNFLVKLRKIHGIPTIFRLVARDRDYFSFSVCKRRKIRYEAVCKWYIVIFYKPFGRKNKKIESVKRDGLKF